MPILILEEVSSKDKYFGLSRILGETNNLLYITTLQQAAHAFKFFICLSIEFSAKLKVSLLF
jgi:hypothetical protein